MLSLDFILRTGFLCFCEPDVGGGCECDAVRGGGCECEVVRDGGSLLGWVLGSCRSWCFLERAEDIQSDKV